MTLEAVISKTMLYLHKFPNDVSQFTTEFLTEKAGEIFYLKFYFCFKPIFFRNLATAKIIIQLIDN